MPKKGMKNFIISFILSLLAVIAVNKAVFLTPSPKQNPPEKKENHIRPISLFSSNGKDVPALNSLLSETAQPDIKIADVSELDKLTAEIKIHNQQDKIVLSSLDDVPAANATASQMLPETLRPLENAHQNQQAFAKDKTVKNEHKTKITAIDIDLQSAQEIKLEPIETSTLSESLNDYEKSGIVYTDISDTLQDEKIQNAENIYSDIKEKSVSADANNAEHALNNESTQLVENAGFNNTPLTSSQDQVKVIADVAQEKINIKEDSTQALSKNDNLPSGKIIVAANSLASPSQDTLENTEEIPLTENTQALHESVDVLHSADATQVAMLEPNNFIRTIEETDQPEQQSIAETDLKQDEWVQMSEKTEESPWVLAKGNKFAKNRSVVEHFADVEAKDAEAKELQEALNPSPKDTSANETQVAYKMIQNLLIPIPEDIMNDGDLTPQLSATPANKPLEKAKSAETEKKAIEKSAELKDSEKQSGLFKSIATWFSGETTEHTKTNGKKSKNRPTKGGISFFGNADDSEDGQLPSQIMPAELRLSFQPNRAEISGQTLRWIHAFADNARDNDNIYIEIRIDGTSSFALQQKRLNLLSTILANRGVDFRKINIVFTSREPNSFIIRNIRFNNDEEVVVNKNRTNSYYRPW